MKQKTFAILLGAEAALLLALTALTDVLPSAFSSLVAFPLEQIAAGLRALSQAGGVFNGFALMLFVGISALPLVPMLAGIRVGARRWENIALVATSVFLAIALYALANPDTMPLPDKSMLPVVTAIMCGTVWSLVICYAVLRLLRLFGTGGTRELYAYLRVLLRGLCILFVGAVCLSCAGELTGALRSTRLPADALIACIRFAVSALPYAMNIAVTFCAVALLERLLAGERTEAAAGAESLSKLCCISLGLVTASTAALNLAQLALAKYISDISASVNIPIMSLAFVLAAFLFARLIAENGRLADENDSFI